MVDLDMAPKGRVAGGGTPATGSFSLGARRSALGDEGRSALLQ